MTAPVTGLYAGILGLFLVVLAWRVSMTRSRLRVWMGHGDDLHLALAIRTHGNAVEWIVPMLLLFLVAELDGANRIFLHACGVTFVVARIAHARGLSRTGKESPGRFWGTLGSWLVLAALAVWDIAAFARSGFLFR